MCSTSFTCYKNWYNLTRNDQNPFTKKVEFQGSQNAHIHTIPFHYTYVDLLEQIVESLSVTHFRPTMPQSIVRSRAWQKAWGLTNQFSNHEIYNLIAKFIK